ncbi:hypothetical protein KO566_00140 [Flavobacteriaceae bacterium XHP0103]|uniref:hypothetical protein n=1 Tax=Marixanthotalea marina TaxID=2844359 RepID=UPI002989F584|nr:hypothetical protein [Marixanthotalea marina]MBU3820453.1 hypothetical protein [Marixanthotalea marina]
MYKKAVATFFMVIFMGLITAPSLIIALDNSIDTSMFYSIAEEEENGKSISVLSPFSIVNNEYQTPFDIKDYQFFSYQNKNYPKPHLNLISPPPERNIL